MGECVHSPNLAKVMLFQSRGRFIAITAVASVSRSSSSPLKRAGKHAFAHVCRPLVCVAAASLASHSSIARLRGRPCWRLHAHVDSGGLTFLTLLALRLRRVSSSLERGSPVDTGRRGVASISTSSPLAVYGFPKSLACSSV